MTSIKNLKRGFLSDKVWSTAIYEIIPKAVIENNELLKSIASKITEHAHNESRYSSKVISTINSLSNAEKLGSEIRSESNPSLLDIIGIHEMHQQSTQLNFFPTRNEYIFELTETNRLLTTLLNSQKLMTNSNRK